MQKLTLKLLGIPQISLGEQLLTQFISRKAQALLIYIAVVGQPCRREALADLFWCNMSSHQALKNLRTVLPNLRQRVGSHLIISRQTIEFNRNGIYSLDTEAIQAIQNRKTDNAQWLSEVISQYQGDFLEGFCIPDAPDFESWILMERERLRELAIAGLHTLAAQHLVRQDYTAGLAVTRKLLQLDPWRETAHQQMMIFLACTNQRRAALAQYATCRQMLAGEFNAEPMAFTTQLYEQIRLGSVSLPDAATVSMFAGFGKNSSTEPIVLPPSLPSHSDRAIVPTILCDWGEAVDVSVFFGREPELEHLQHNILQTHCRLVLLLGLGGIGKTALATRLAQQIAPQFDAVIWRSLRNAPPLEALLADLVPFLSSQQDHQGTVERLLHWLQQHRCLLVLDNLETILQEGGPAGQYRAGYANYGQFFRSLGEVQHQSCVVLTSREKLAEVAMLEGEPAVQVFLLSGSSTVALELLATRKLTGFAMQQQQLAQLYDYNPLALKIVAGLIHDLFGGSIEAFLQQGVVLFNGVRRLLEQQFERLSALEKSIMYWLAINRDWTSVAELAADIIPVVPRPQLLEALESLSWRNLIECRQGHYTQQPMMMEYVTNTFVEKLVSEIIEQGIGLLHEFSLLKTDYKEYIRETQRRLILIEIVDQLQTKLNSPGQLQDQLWNILTQLHHSADLSGYAAGNLLNLCSYLQMDLTGADFSGLTIWQADLRGIGLQSVNFQNSRFARTLFTQTSKSSFALAFNPEGTLLSSGDNMGNLTVRRVSDGTLLTSWQGHSTTIWTIAWSADGKTIATGSNDGTICHWNPFTGHCLQTIQATSVVWMVAWSSDGRMLASAGSEDALRLWDMQTGCCVKVLATQQHWSKVVVWTPDGQQLISGGNDGTLKFWHVETGELMQTLVGHDQEVWHLALSSGQRPLLASSSADQTVRIWDLQTGQCLQVLQGHNNSVLRLAWSADGNTLASSSDDATIRLWNVQIGQCLRVLQGHQNSIWSMAWSPAASLLASGSADHTTRLWNPQTGDCLSILQGYSACARALAWHRDSETLVTGSDDHALRLWNTTTGHCLNTWRGQTNYIWSVAWSPDDQMIACCSDNSTIELWHAQTGTCTRTLTGHTSWVWAVVWSADGSRLFSGSNDKSIRVWDRQGRCLQRLETDGWVTALDISPDGSRLTSGGNDCQIELWNVETGKCSQKLQGHTAWIWSMAWSPDGSLLATGGEDGTLRLWQVQTGRCLRVLEPGLTRIFSVAWSPDSQQIACAGSDSVVQIWNVRTGRCIRRLEGHTGLLWAVAWQPAGRLLASASDDDTVRIWDVKTGDCCRILKADRPYEGMQITGVKGLTEAQKIALQALGACESSKLLQEPP